MTKQKNKQKFSILKNHKNNKKFLKMQQKYQNIEYKQKTLTHPKPNLRGLINLHRDPTRSPEPERARRRAPEQRRDALVVDLIAPRGRSFRHELARELGLGFIVPARGIGARVFCRPQSRLGGWQRQR